MRIIRTIQTNKLLQIFFAVILAAFLFLAFSGWQARAQTPEPLLPADAPDASDAVVGPFTCSVEFIAVFNNRIVLRCTEPQENILFDFAVATDAANSALANRYLTLMNTAYAMNVQVRYYYNNLSSNNPPGCQTNTCRKLEGLYLQ